MKTAIVTHVDYVRHLTGYGHPERPERVASILTALYDAGLMTPENTLHPQPASEEDIALAHTLKYIHLVEQECLEAEEDGSTTLSTGDAQICPLSYEIARLAAGGVLAAVDVICQDNCKRAFAVVRPPGHHARSAQGMGFCLFNNIAIGARYAQERYGLERILIVDWDVHHGNGTQDIFYDDGSVFYFSTHRAHFYPPGTGLPEQRGAGKGEGTCLNIPIEAAGDPRSEILHAYSVALPKVVEDFKPQLIMISAGFDAHELDPLGGFNLLSEDFGTLTRFVTAQAEEFCDGKVLSVLEGGYDLQALAEGAVHHVNALCGY